MRQSPARRVLPLAIGLAAVAGLALASVPAAPAWAEPGPVTGRVIVKFEASTEVSARGGDILRTAARRAGAQVTEVRTLTTGARLVAVRGEAAEDAAARLAGVDGVEYAVVDRFIRRSAVTPTARYSSEQWNLRQSTAGINLPGAAPWSTGSEVRVAVVDTGKTKHPDLDAAWLGGHDFIDDPFVSNDGGGRDINASDPGDHNAVGECRPVFNEGSPSSWHGTHVAGIIAARGAGIDGVAPRTRIVPVRALGKCGGYESDILEGVAWASGAPVSGVPANRYPARVINLSLGGSAPCDAFARDVFQQVRKRNALVVVAAGNESRSASSSWPVNCGSTVFTVAATDRTGRLAGLSNRGAAVDVSAPGIDIPSTINSGRTKPGAPAYAAYSGTSMAAPHVSAIAALLLAVRPTLTAAELDASLRRAVTPVKGASSNCCGSGLTNAKRAIDTVVPSSVIGTWSARKSTLGTFRSIRTLPDATVWATFSQGHITRRSHSATYAITGPIAGRWVALGGAATMGGAVSDEHPGRAGHRQQKFVRAWILSSNRGAFSIEGRRLTYWTKLSDDHATTLGQLRSSAVVDSASGTTSSLFTNGAIVDSPKGTFWMRGPIHAQYRTLGTSLRRALGPLVSVETAGVVSGQRASRFTGGTIYYSATSGAWPILAEIDRRYRATGVARPLGSPTGLPQTTPTGARLSTFEYGVIYADASAGVWDVRGTIAEAYQYLGAHDSDLGLPTGPEVSSDTTISQTFQGGRISETDGIISLEYS